MNDGLSPIAGEKYGLMLWAAVQPRSQFLMVPFVAMGVAAAAALLAWKWELPGALVSLASVAVLTESLVWGPTGPGGDGWVAVFGAIPGGLFLLDCALRRSDESESAPKRLSRLWIAGGAVFAIAVAAIAIKAHNDAERQTIMEELTGRYTVRFDDVDHPLPRSPVPMAVSVNVRRELFVTPLLSGRQFTPQDCTVGRTVVINHAMAKTYWLVGDPVGHQIAFGASSGTKIYTIIGVTEDLTTAHQGRPSPEMYTCTPDPAGR
jgi:hypothetical protein